jgi:hypothetical protein
MISIDAWLFLLLVLVGTFGLESLMVRVVYWISHRPEKPKPESKIILPRARR